MNIRAKCSNRDCQNCGIEKSVAVGMMMGFGVRNERIKCPVCGGLMTTTKSINTSSKDRSKSGPRSSRRYESKRSSKRR
jgi:hypothetical protein